MCPINGAPWKAELLDLRKEGKGKKRRNDMPVVFQIDTVSIREEKSKSSIQGRVCLLQGSYVLDSSLYVLR